MRKAAVRCYKANRGRPPELGAWQVSVSLALSVQPHMNNTVGVRLARCVQPHKNTILSVSLARSVQPHKSNIIGVNLPRCVQPHTNLNISGAWPAHQAIGLCFV